MSKDRPSTVSKKTGFTLIEVLIALAIIGLIASIAVPVYQDYVLRSQIQGALKEVSDLKINAEHRIVSGKTITSVSDIGGETMGAFGQLSVDASTLDDMAIEIEMGAGSEANVSGAVEGAKIQMDRNAEGEWTCKVAEPGGSSGWDDAYIPVGCQKDNSI